MASCSSLSLTNARPLDVHKWSDYPEVNFFVNHIYNLLIGLDGNERINKKHLKVLLLDLYVAWLADPTLKIMFSRNNNSYRSKSRYNEIHIGKKIIAVVDALSDVGLLNQKLGFNDRISGTAFQSRLWPSEKLIEYFYEAKFHQFCIHSNDDRETIVLRDENKVDIEDYKDTIAVKRMRQLLYDYNKLLAATHIDIETLDVPVLTIGSGKKKMTLQISQQDKFVRRIFNNSRWDQGGRFYGGWWQRCPKQYRMRIVFDHVLTAEIDFSGLHIIILYAQQGVDYWLEVNRDPYILPNLAGIDPEIDMRSVAKSLLLIAINSNDEAQTYRAFKRQAKSGSREKKLTDSQLSAILVGLKQLHEPIADSFASGAGINLMYVDSQITAKIIERFTYHYKCPILTIHDSYIVPFGYDYILKEEMQKAFEAVTGISSARVKHTTAYYDLLDYEGADWSEVLPSCYDSSQPSQRHLEEVELFRVFKDKPQREDWVSDRTAFY
jgi:hypothetical protein